MGGALECIQSVGCVYVELKDTIDGAALTLPPTGIDVTLPSGAPLPTQRAVCVALRR